MLAGFFFLEDSLHSAMGPSPVDIPNFLSRVTLKPCPILKNDGVSSSTSSIKYLDGDVTAVTALDMLLSNLDSLHISVAWSILMSYSLLLPCANGIIRLLGLSLSAKRY